MADPTAGPRTDIANKTLILRGLHFDTIWELGEIYLASTGYDPWIYHHWDIIMTALGQAHQHGLSNKPGSS